MFEQQSSQRQQIRDDIKEQQGNIDKYREQAQDTINGANEEINRLQTLSTGNVDEIILKTEEYNTEIDVIYDEWQKTLEPLREKLNTKLNTTNLLITILLIGCG